MTTQASALTKATDTRELVIESAYACFRKQGLQKVTIVDIAKAAGVSRSTIYEYFRDKAAIVEACAESASQWFYREMSNAMDRGGSLEDKLSRAAVLVTAARRVIASEKYFDVDAISLLLTKDAAVLLAECVDFFAPPSPRPSSPARSAKTSTSRPPVNGSRESCSRCSAHRHRRWKWTILTSLPTSCARTWSAGSPTTGHGRDAVSNSATAGPIAPRSGTKDPAAASCVGRA